MPSRTRDSGAERPGFAQRANARAFTLLEILIALALATTLVSLVSVAVFGRLREATFDETIRQTRSALTLIREDARREGEPLRLIARENDEGRIELVGLPFDAPVEDPFAIEDEDSARGEIDTTRIAFEEDSTQRTTMDDRAPGRIYLTLPRNYKLERMTPEEREEALELMEPGRREEQAALDAEMLSGFQDEMNGFGFDDLQEGPVTIGLFLPDGSVIGGEPPILTTPSGAMLEIRINPWTGSVTLEPIRPVDPFDRALEEELDPPMDDADMTDDRDNRGDGP